MKTFKDLKFESHYNPHLIMMRAHMDFDNGYGVSVVQGDHVFAEDGKPYELAVMVDGMPCYDSGITKNVIGYLTARGVTKYMKKVQQLKRRVT